MKKLSVTFLFAALLFAGIFWGIQAARGQAESASPSEKVLTSETQGQNTRETYAPDSEDGLDQPLIGFIDSPTATCYMPNPEEDVCYINWYYMSVDANPNYMISMTVSLEEPYGRVAEMRGFFQTSMYVPYNMLGNGFRVPCGTALDPAHPSLGNQYSYTIRARDSAALGSANYGLASCPAYTP